MPITEPYEELPEDEFIYDQDFLILIDSANEPGGGIAFSANAQEATVVALIPWNKMRSAARYLCGFSYADEDTPYRLYREPPMCHPRLPNLRCSGANFAGFGIKSGTWTEGTFTPSNEDGYPLVEEPWQGPRGETLRSAQYAYVLATVRYRSFNMMRFLPDADINDYTDEHKRYFTIEVTASVETLSADGASNLKFAEGPAVGKAFQAPLAQLLTKANITMTWANVPHNYISDDPITFSPAKLIERLGTWNTDQFLGYKVGTMLFLGFEAEPVLFPVLATDPINDIPFVGWNIRFHFSHFDPQKGVVPVPPATSDYNGHRIFPLRTDGFFYFATRDGTTSGNELLPGTEHWKLFQHVGDPS